MVGGLSKVRSCNAVGSEGGFGGVMGGGFIKARSCNAGGSEGGFGGGILGR